MANLTLVISDELLKRARVRAAEEGTSVNAVARAAIERYGGADPAAASLRSFLEFADGLQVQPAPDPVWNRDDVYAERLGRLDA